MSNSIEALAMAGEDYNEWGMDFEEWERMEMGPPPPHLFSEDYEEDERVEGGVMMPTSTVDVLCGVTEVKNQLVDVFDDPDMSNVGDDEFQRLLPKYYNKIVKCDHGIKRFKILVIVIMVIRFLRRQILSTM
ncbi:unnamed protein product [Lactuca saligna]|uniref:Uncharacterized protein n=1 Tax=Lactuca saligna TaxID=75948 RepID=A0AA35VN95_LACSI|nr:unnamed protein product [Lactuca saligna]